MAGRSNQRKSKNNVSYTKLSGGKTKVNVNSASLDTTCDGQTDSSQIVDVSGSDSESSSSEIDLDSIKKDSAEEMHEEVNEVLASQQGE